MQLREIGLEWVMTLFLSSFTFIEKIDDVLLMVKWFYLTVKLLLSNN